MKNHIILLVALLIPFMAASQAGVPKSRLIVLADMGNELDEEQQIMHLLVCSNEFQLEGLIAVTGAALHPGNKDPYKQKLHPELFHRLIDGYAKVYQNLQHHAKGWHTPDYLHDIVARGQTGYGVEDIGEGQSSAGSKLIIACVTKPEPRPVHVDRMTGLKKM